ncbi:MAG: DUF4276 family protein [Chloroflexi bacterium]|nr:DUF4276 family protein [Chloroflexota bacterium]
MKVVLLVEGWTEKALPAFLKRWLDPRLPQPVGIKPVRFEGEGHYRQKAAKRVELYLAEDDTLAVFGLLDLYGLKLSFPPGAGRDEKIAFARDYLHREIGGNHPKFRQHFAVHDVEAWLIAAPSLFPRVRLPEKCARPEEVDFTEPPSKLLARLTGRNDKVTRAANLFPRLEPSLVYQKCPNFKLMLDEMLDFARGTPPQ